MLNSVKKFLEANITLLEKGDYRKFFLRAYEQELTTAAIREIDDILRENDIFNSVDLRNTLLFEKIQENIDYLKQKYENESFEDVLVRDGYAVQFLRYYLANTFGFLEQEAVEFMYDNQDLLGVKLTDTSSDLGQSGIRNYIIHYEN